MLSETLNVISVVSMSGSAHLQSAMNIIIFERSTEQLAMALVKSSERQNWRVHLIALLTKLVMLRCGRSFQRIRLYLYKIHAT